MASFTLNEWIQHPPQAVFDFITNIGNAPQIMAGVIRAEQIDAGPVAVGTRFRELRLVRGLENAAILEVVVHEPPRRFAVKNEQNGFRITYDYTLRPEQGGTQVQLAAQVQAAGLRRLIAPFIARVIKKEDGTHLQNLKRLLEHGDAGII